MVVESDPSGLTWRRPPEQRPRFGWWIVAVLLGVAVVAVGGVAAVAALRGGPASGATASGAVAPDAGAAVAEKACREELLSGLKSPSSAVVTVEKSTHPAPTFYIVSGSLDAENAFGAMLRDTWECQAGVVDGRRGGVLTALGSDRWSVDEKLAVVACEDAVGAGFDVPPVRFGGEIVTAETVGWRVTGNAHFGEDGGFGAKPWGCEVVADPGKGFGQRMTVTLVE